MFLPIRNETNSNIIRYRALEQNNRTMPDLSSFDLIADLESRQDELIRQLDHLNDRIEAALSEHTPSSATESADRVSRQA